MIKIIILVLLAVHPTLSQQCTTLTDQRCLCSTASPYCPCSAITTTNALNFTSSYYSHLVSVSGQGCRPCPSSCLTCTSLTACTQCQSSFQFSGTTCIPCPINCQTCSNGVCSVCNNGYYLDYYTVCQSCPIAGTNVCTISSLISCLSNFWLDNNAANCMQCDPNCQQCSSTTKCNICTSGFYLLSNYTCAACSSFCRTCLDNSSCLICANTSLHYNASTAQCLSNSLSNCYISLNSTACQQCDSTSYLNSNHSCTSILASSLINGCEQYGLLSNASIYCKNCTVGLFNTSNYCQYGCSILCTSCYGAHYGLCYSCISNSYLSNSHCLPSYNIEAGSAFQMFYTAFNNPSFFSNGSLLTPVGCFPQTLYGQTSQFSFSLVNLQIYMVAVKWKIYIYGSSSSSNGIYTVNFSNSKSNSSYSFTAAANLSGCSSVVLVDKNGLSVSGIITTTNLLTFTVQNASIGISEVLVVGYRCGGIQGTACLQCSSTSTCTKCVNANYYISGYTCLQTCPSSSFIRTAYRSCQQSCPAATYTDYLHQYCIECTSPCATCSSNTTCLTCIPKTYLYNGSCLTICPAGYYSYDLSNTCEACLRPCLTCLSNFKCLSCLYGFYINATYSCALSCSTGYYGNINTLSCELCLSPCLTCNQYVGTQCQTCISGYYYYDSKCLVTCPNGFYSSNTSQCLNCDSICLSCQNAATYCLSCRLGTYFLNNSCLGQCPSMYFAQSVSKSCRSCPANCLSCLSLSYCQSCLNGSYFYAQNYSCLSTCPQYYYNNAGKCSNCQLPCIKCLSQTACLSCSGLFIYNYSCTASCPATTYGDTLTMKCESCNATLCLQCFNSPSYCTKCQVNKILFGNECLDSCPVGYYYSKTSLICSRCDKKCLACSSATFCVSCVSNYILQNGTCSKNCISGYYLILINSTTSCLPCGTGCSTCQFTNSSLICTSCLTGYFLFNASCFTSCAQKYYSSNAECFQCPLPCLTCSSQTVCTSCYNGYGAFFNGSCLNQCPLGYYTNSTSNMCNSCLSSCLKCESAATNCSSCNSTLFLQSNSCLSACTVGQYAAVNSNICQKCQKSCLRCSFQPSNCTSCQSLLILSNNLCLQYCPSGSYFSGNSCVSCPVGCSSCSSPTNCFQCKVTYFLNQANLCILACDIGYFGYNGLCRKCSYPCRECNNSAICLNCAAGYYYNGNCLWNCPTSTYLNLTLSTCSNCPTNCSSCTNSTNCLQCSSGVLVSGYCQQNCPLGYFSYYSVCAPCMYGCLVCTGSNTCSQCYIGFLYQSLCLQMCPTGWVSITSSNTTYCQKCISGCLKCTVLPNQCISCASGLFLYVFSCIKDCPLGTYQDYSSGSCLSCTTPCSTCQNGYSCLTCIYGYILYSQANGNQCIEGPKCPNSYYLNLQTNNCVYSCPPQLYTEPSQGTCSKPCPNSYVLLSSNSTCLEYCPDGMWIDENYTCRNQSRPQVLPQFKCTTLILRNLLVFDCLFNKQMANLNSLTIKNFSIPNVDIAQILVLSEKEIRIITTMSEGVVRTSFITISLVYRYQLKSVQDTKGRNLQTLASLPLQNTVFTVFLGEYYAYGKDQRRTGMQLMQISQSICIGALIFWFFALLKNLNSTSLTFILLLQWLHSFSLVDTNFSSNLGQFLEGFRFANLFWASSAANNQFLWKIGNSYREVLWGVANYFAFSTTMFPSLCIICFFLMLFAVSLFLYWKFKEATPEQMKEASKKLKEQEGSEKKQEQSIISNVPSEKDKDEKSHQSGQNASKHSIHNLTERKPHFQAQKHQNDPKKVSIFSKNKFLQQQKQKKKLQEQQSWQKTKAKLSAKSKIINDRFYYNYCLHCILLTSSPISIAIYCQLIAASPLPLVFSLIFFLAYIAIIVKFVIFACGEQKLYVSTKYCFIMFIQTLIFNGLAVLSTAQIYIGVSILILIINLYVWKRIFNTQKSKDLKHFHQINEIIRIIVLIEGLVGYTNKKKWSSDTYYNYSWVFIGTVIIMVIAVAIQSTKQFINQDQGVKAPATQTHIQEKQTISQTESKAISKHYSSNEVIEGQDDEKKEEQNFFSEEEAAPDTESDSDIIDFDENTSLNGEKAPKELIKYEKRPALQNE